MTTKTEFKEGDRVVYRPVGGTVQTSIGTIKKILTHPEEVGTRHTEVKASESEPRYVCGESIKFLLFTNVLGD
jgi:hypothetical protein